jgi:putative NADH-flavin reductase
MKRVVVFGASGETGRRIVMRALEAGHEVVAVHRTPPSVMAVHERHTVHMADPLKADEIRKAIEGADVVVHAIGPKRSAGARVTVSSEVMANLLPAMRELGVRRLLFVSAFGTGASRRGFYTKLLWTAIRRRMEDKERAEAMLRASGLEWFIALPTILMNAPPTGRYRVGTGLDVTAFPRISRDDVADLIVRRIEGPEMIGTTVEITD